jgi:membrane protein involved in D-alanine export
LLLPLAIYKASAVFDQSLLGFLGISYITFKAIQVLIEVRDGLIKELSVFEYLYFLTFFAPFTSGPIDRSRRFSNDLEQAYSRSEYAGLLTRGLVYFLIGTVYKVVLAAIFFDQFSFNITSYSYILMPIAAAAKDAYAYGLYLFFDFAGYSLMAVGISYCFGIKTPMNFKFPFISTDIKDFWDRWHITLSHWLRDFVFMRFSRLATKKKLFKSRLTTACCGYIINMMVMGIWHGLTVDYLTYGLYHGLLLAGTDVFQKKSKFYKRHKSARWFKIASWAVTINLIMFGFALFSGQVRILIGGL